MPTQPAPALFSHQQLTASGGRPGPQGRDAGAAAPTTTGR